MDRPGIALLCLLALPSACAAAESLSIEPGQWKVTSSTVMNGATAPTGVKARCLTAEDAGDLLKTFGPRAETINSTCAPTVFETTERRLKWHMQCKGQIDIEVVGDFNFDSPSHYTASVSSQGWMAGSLISDVKTELLGERIGDCQQ